MKSICPVDAVGCQTGRSLTYVGPSYWRRPLAMNCIEVVHNGGKDCGNGGHSSPFGGRMFCLRVPWVDLGRG